MSIPPSRWTVITPSPHPWERAALDWLQAQLPDIEPFRAWANFEFIADDGSINEVDLLLVSAQRLYLVEIKSRPGRLSIGIYTSARHNLSHEPS